MTAADPDSSAAAPWLDQLLALPHAERLARIEALPAEQREALMAAMQRRGVTPNPLLNFLGARLVELTDDHSLVELTISDNVRQQTGAVHASVLVALADMAASLLARRAAGGTPPLAININAALVGNQRDGVIRAEARFIRQGRRVTVVGVTVSGEDDRVLANVTTTHVPVEASDRSPA